MFTRLKSRQILAQWKSLCVSKQIARHCSDIKTNEDLLFSSHAPNTIPSPMRIKSTLKNGFYDFVDGFTSVQTSCPVCLPLDDNQPHGMTTENKKCIFINKTTGELLRIPSEEKKK